MNIYLHLEIAARELDSRLLLAVIAASRGFHVTIADVSTLMALHRAGLLAPGIFHTKSLTPKCAKISRHQELKEAGYLITSQDEESGLNSPSFDNFAKARFADQTLQQVDAVFTWGRLERDRLTALFPLFSEKFILSGSPRVDMWSPLLVDYYTDPPKLPDVPFVLFASNFGSAVLEQALEKCLAENFEWPSDQDLSSRLFRLAERLGGRTGMALAFISGVISMASLLSPDKCTIVVRPHPAEDQEIWEKLLLNVANVRILRIGNITNWMRKSTCVVHNGCTSAIEATISNVPVITFTPFDINYGALPNSLGHSVSTLKELNDSVLNVIKNDRLSNYPSQDPHKTMPEMLTDKLLIEDFPAASLKIVDYWTTLSSTKNIPHQFWLRGVKKKILFKAWRWWRSLNTNKTYNPDDQLNCKIPNLIDINLSLKVEEIKKTLGIDVHLSVELITNKSIVITKSKS